MRRMHLVKSFLIGMGIFLFCLVSMAHTARAGCEQKRTLTPSGGSPTTLYGGSRAAPISLSPGGALGVTCGAGYYADGYYTAFIESIPELSSTEIPQLDANLQYPEYFNEFVVPTE